MYFLRQRTRVSGPFTAEQIKGLLHRGRIARSDKVSTDRTTWQAIAAMPELIDRPQPAEPTAAEPAAETPPQDTRLWYHTRGGAQQPAPVDTETLRQMVQSGQVGGAEMVWTEGFADWQPVLSVPEFGSAAAPGFPEPGGFPPIQGFDPMLDLPPVIRKKGWM